jgi:drug/metabolite transporter (DMT)-like permease
VVEQFGIVLAGMVTLLLGGGLGLLYHALITRKLGVLLRLPRRYLLGGGLLVVGYLVCLYIALGLAVTRRQVLDIGLINYLWPSLTLLLSVPLLHHRARPWLPVGILLALAGVVLATSPAGVSSLGEFVGNMQRNSAAYLCALAAAVLWALYSNLSRRWAGDAPVSGMPLFIAAAGLAMALLLPAFPPPAIRWTVPGVLALLYVAVGPTLLAYVLWDLGVQRGSLTLLAALSNFIPLFSTVVSSLILGVALGPQLWLAVVLLVAGAVICHAGVEESGDSANVQQHEAGAGEK